MIVRPDRVTARTSEFHQIDARRFLRAARPPDFRTPRIEPRLCAPEMEKGSAIRIIRLITDLACIPIEARQVVTIDHDDFLYPVVVDVIAGVKELARRRKTLAPAFTPFQIECDHDLFGVPVG